MKRLFDENRDVRWQALYTLTRLRDPCTLPSLAQTQVRVTDSELQQKMEMLIRSIGAERNKELLRIRFPASGSTIPDNPLEVRGRALESLSSLRVVIHTDMDWSQDKGSLRWLAGDWLLDECYFGGKHNFVIHYIYATGMDENGLEWRSNVVFCRGLDMSVWLPKAS